MNQKEENFFKWEDRYQLKVEQMDQEHKRLILLMNDLHQLHSKSASFSQVLSKLEELYRYTVLHFNHEEKYFSQLSYEKAEVHKSVHKSLLGKLETYSKQIQLEKKIPSDFFDFLKFWLSAHIMGVDQGYAKVAQAA